MTDAPRIRPLLKRGALVTAANWPVVAIQFVADTSFKVLLAVPVAGGALLVGAAAGGDLDQLAAGRLQVVVANTVDALAAAPAALGAFLAAFALVVVGGSIPLFLIKGGTVTVLADAERRAGPIERPPLRLAAIRRVGRFGVERFLAGATRLARRYLTLGLALLGVYAVSGGAYLAVVVAAYRAPAGATSLVAWSAVTALATTVFFLWITLVNLAYLLLQMVVAADDCGVRAAARRVAAFLRHSAYDVAGVFGVVLALVVLATTASIVATAGLGLIAFVPVVGLIVLPLQFAAWLLRGILFQYLGLTALGAYLAQYRGYRRAIGLDPPRPAVAPDVTPFPEGRTA